jgi:hypothetical protein
MQLTFGGPQYAQIASPNKNWWEPAAHTAGNYLWQIILAKAAHNMRMEAMDRELEAHKIDTKAKADENKLKATSEANLSGVKINPEPTGAEGEVFDQYLGGYVTPPQPTVVQYEGKKFVVDRRGMMHPINDVKETRPDVKTYTSPTGEIRTFDTTKDSIPPGWYPSYLDKRFKQTGNEPQAHWQRKQRFIAGAGDKKMVQDYDYNPVTREEKLVGQPYEAPKGFNFLESLITGNLPGQAPQQAQPQQQPGMTREEMDELEELRRRLGR